MIGWLNCSPLSEGSSRPGPWRTGSWWTSPSGRPARQARSCIPPVVDPGCWSGPTRPLSCSYDLEREGGKKIIIELWDLDLSEYSIFYTSGISLQFYPGKLKSLSPPGAYEDGGVIKVVHEAVQDTAELCHLLWSVLLKIVCLLHCTPDCTRTQNHLSCQHLGKLVDMTEGRIT